MSVSETRLKSAFSPYGAWCIFLAGLTLFLVFQTGMVLEIQLSRVLPPEAKDAYRYIYSALQLREGYNFNTPALNDLRTQSNPEPGDAIDRKNLKWDNYHSLFMTHFILHSALLVVISSIFGISLGLAYKITAVLGSLLIAGAISYFLLTITDRTSAGLALASLAITMFPIQGIHYVVPTNIGMAVGLFLISIALRNGGRSRWWFLGLSIICLSLHRMGIIYVGLGIMISIILRYKGANKKQLILDLLPTIVLVALYICITYIFPLKIFRLSPMATPPGTNYFMEVWANFQELLKLTSEWFLTHGVAILPKSLLNMIIYKFSPPVQNLIRDNWVFLFLGSQVIGLCLLIIPWRFKNSQEQNHRIFRWLIFLCGAIILLPIFSAFVLLIILRAGWLYPPPEKKVSFFLSFFLFLFLLFPSLLHVMYIAEPDHSIIRADLTNRLWVPFALVLAAIFGRGLWWLFQEIRHGSWDFLPKMLPAREQLKLYCSPRCLLAIIILFLVIGYAPHLVEAYNYRDNIKYFMIIRQNVQFDPDQIQWLYNNSSPHDIIIYDDDFIRHFFLSHGGLERRAIFLPLLPLPESYYFLPEDLKYEIGWNPFLAVQHYQNVRAIEYPLTIPGGSIYTLTFDSHFQPGELHLLPGLSSAGKGSSKLRIVRELALGMTETSDIQLEGESWQVYTLPFEQGGKLSLINLDPSKPLVLAGLKFGEQPTQDFMWPWHGVVEVSLDDKRLQIQRTAVVPGEKKIGGVAYNLEVLQDRGSTVLWRLRPLKKN